MAHKFPLDLSKFKKLSSDEHATKLKHPDGHEITIAHKPLSPKMKEQLSKLSMADGGEVINKDQEKQPIGRRINFPGYRDSDKQQRKYADGGKVEKSDDEIIAEKAKIDKENKEAVEYGASPKEYPEHIQRKLAATDVTPKKYAEGTPEAPVQPQSIPITTDESQVQLPQSIINPEAGEVPQQDPNLVTAGKTLADLQPKTPISQESQPNSPKADQNQPKTPMDQALEGSPSMGTPDMLQGYGQQIQGSKLEAQAESQAGTARAKDYADSIKLQQDYQKNFQDQAQKINTNIKNLIDDINTQKIDPSLYWNTHDKMSTAIGLIVAGFNPTNSPNAAIDFLHKQMQMNLEAQKADLGRKNNLLSAYVQQFGNLKDAAQMYNITQQAILINKLDSEAAKVADPMAKARLLQNIGKIQAGLAPQYNEFLMKRSALQMLTDLNGNPDQAGKAFSLMRVMDRNLADDMADHYIPGVGTSTNKITPETRNQIASQQALINASQHLQDWVNQNRGSLSPEKRAEGEALATELQQFYRQATQAGVSEGEKKTIENLINSTPGDFLHAFTTNPKLRAMETSMTQRLNALKHVNGLPTQQPRPLESETRMFNGMEYRKVPGGWQKVK